MKVLVIPGMLLKASGKKLKTLQNWTEKCRDFTTIMSENDGSTIKVTKWS